MFTAWLLKKRTGREEVPWVTQGFSWVTQPESLGHAVEISGSRKGRIGVCSCVCNKSLKNTGGPD